ncbi:MAG TPA: metallophosphoesterase [Caulifigura sp.]|jgi:DNA repair exonuclease SbcCD nuclease subunit|nr:metallophosphoesterase [Caulifigura sp.]
MADRRYTGLLLIGDPHLEGRQPGFRKDDYPSVILQKLTWALDYAEEHRLLPAILGDLFDKPRDNPNWLLVTLLGILQGREVLGLYGNHDVHYNPELTEHDSLQLLVQAGVLKLVTAESPWTGTMNGRRVVVGGSSYRHDIPDVFSVTLPEAKPSLFGSSPLVVWMTHHDILCPGYDDGRIKPSEIDGIDLVINGHIHRRLDPVECGRTTWLTPGNISRRSRNDASRQHIPSVLRVDVRPDGYDLEYITVPHQPFEDVFHSGVVETVAEERPSAFVEGLAELQSRRTAGGAGLIEFLNQNLTQFESAVADEIRRLAKEVTSESCV